MGIDDSEAAEIRGGRSYSEFGLVETVLKAVDDDKPRKQGLQTVRPGAGVRVPGACGDVFYIQAIEVNHVSSGSAEVV